jgi:hypothetical protein
VLSCSPETERSALALAVVRRAGITMGRYLSNSAPNSPTSLLDSELVGCGLDMQDSARENQYSSTRNQRRTEDR